MAVATYAGLAACNAFYLPRREVDTYVFPPECRDVQSRGNAHKGSQLECRERLTEAVTLQAYPSLASRDGESLTIFYQGRQTASLVPDTDAANGCDSYNLKAILRLYDQASRTLEPLVQVSCSMGEFERRFVVLPNGTNWLAANASASPDGRLIASGDNSLAGTGFTIHDWPSLKPVARFAPSCRVIRWITNDHLVVTCLHHLVEDAGEPFWFVVFDASVERKAGGQWVMRTQRWLDPQNSGYTVNSDLEYVPAFSWLWPMTFKAGAA